MLNFSLKNSIGTLDAFQFCNLSYSGNDKDISLHYITIASVCIFLTITATLGNSLILFALHKDTSLHPPSKVLLRSLAMTDLCVGVLGQPVTIILIFSALFERWSLCHVTQMLMQVSNAIFSGISLLTSSAISVDRLLALLLRLRYRQIVTVKRVRVTVFLFWLVGTSLISILFFMSMLLYHIVGVVWMLLLLVISTYSYTRIFLTIRRQQMQLQDTHGGQTGGTGLNMARYKKTVFNALWVHLTLVTCYLPSAVVMAFIAVRGLSSSLFLTQGWALTLVYLNSSLNPVLYCWKIKDVRQAVKETIRQFSACFST
ncbi:adenosine receptor A3-like [Oculina patagonica]